MAHAEHADQTVSEQDAFLLAAIVASSDDAIVSKDLNGVIRSWNKAAENMFGYTAEEAIGRPIADLIVPDDRQAEEAEVLSRIRTGLSVERYETVRRRKDGSTLDVSLTVSPIRNRLGQVIGASKIARDITERKRLFSELERANRMKDEFLATLSHELRTPLNAMLGYTRVLKERATDEQMQRAAEVIERNSQTLAQMVSDILDVSAVAAGKIRLEIEVCDLLDVVDAAIAVVQTAADAKGVTLVRDVPSEPVELQADPRRLQQVLWNLLSNAVKFTPGGGTVTIRVAVKAANVVVTVTDTGIGIEPTFLPLVFKRFSQANERATRESGGIGLGLALVRHFLELHGGTVRAQSEGLDRGATFEVILPRRARPVNR
jgi:PAS domain S-box-containing protein